jgi:hypothetical protein
VAVVHRQGVEPAFEVVHVGDAFPDDGRKLEQAPEISLPDDLERRSEPYPGMDLCPRRIRAVEGPLRGAAPELDSPDQPLAEIEADGPGDVAPPGEGNGETPPGEAEFGDATPGGELLSADDDAGPTDGLSRVAVEDADGGRRRWRLLSD